MKNSLDKDNKDNKKYIDKPLSKYSAEGSCLINKLKWLALLMHPRGHVHFITGNILIASRTGRIFIIMGSFRPKTAVTDFLINLPIKSMLFNKR